MNKQQQIETIMIMIEADCFGLNTEQGMCDLVVKFNRDGDLLESEWDEIGSAIVEHEKAERRAQERIAANAELFGC